jgi:hypothetical protein
MVAALKVIADGTQDGNRYLGDKLLREIRQAIEEFQLSDGYAYLWNLELQAGIVSLRLGKERESLAHLERANVLLARVSQSISPRQSVETVFRLGVAYLRLAETENCCARFHEDSCIVPIQGGGLHSRTEGSTKAIEQLARVIDGTDPEAPEHDHARWLLNVAYMTLGRYPDGVPPKYLVPQEVFRSQIPFPRFRNASRDAGVDSFDLSGGAIFDDFDNDGDFDLLTSTWDTRKGLRYFRNDGGGQFVDRTEAAGLDGIFGGLNLVQADYDNDGNLDAFVLRGAWLAAGERHPNSLLRGHGDGTFTDVTFDSGLGDVHFPTQTAAWADFDLDGDLDLFIGNETNEKLTAPCQLFRNEGDGTFTDIAASAGVTNLRFTKGVVWGDYDGDRYPDIFVSNYEDDNRLYRNQGDGTFSDVAALVGVTSPVASFPAWFWDYDNDGNLDLFVSSYSGRGPELAGYYLGRGRDFEKAALFRGDGTGSLEDVAQRENLHFPMLPMGANFGDIDGDGFLDFYLGTGDPEYSSLLPNILCVYRPGKGFVDVTMAAGVGLLQKGHGVSLADFDGDGDVDIFEQVGGAYPGDAYRNALFRNPGFGHRWIRVKVVGKGSNRSAIGTRIRVVIDAGGNTRSIYRWVGSGGSFGANPLEQHIGLGKARSIQRVEIWWPRTDKVQVVEDARLDAILVVTEE